jgi:hypothetical protein
MLRVTTEITKGRSLWRTLAAVVLLVFMLPASAHFLLNLNVRIFHVDHVANGLNIYLRMPMPYVVADKIGPEDATGLPAPAPYTSNRLEDGVPAHYVDFAQLQENSAGLGRLLADGLRIESESGIQAIAVDQVRVYPLGTEPGFATLAEAEQSFQTAQHYPGADGLVYVGDAVVDVAIEIHSNAAIYNYSLSSALDPGLPGQEDTANLILDYSPGSVQVYRERGLLLEPISISRSPWVAFTTFIREGVTHILEGIDHVLFVLCLVLGAAGIKILLWRVTGFTLGHSVTLSLGFFGFVPAAAWFVPAVETAIALSIVYAAAIAVIPRMQTASNEIAVFFITGFIGLIHGLGFSFVLQNILKVSSPDIWQSLLAFNIGIEIGQLIVVTVAGAFLWALARMGGRVSAIGKISIAAMSAAIAIYWVFERAANI